MSIGCRTKRRGYATRAYRNVVQTFESLLDIPAAALTRADVKKALVKQRSSETRPAAARNAVPPWAAAYPLGAERRPHRLRIRSLDSKLPARTSERDRVLTSDEARRIYAAACDLPYPAGHFIRLL